MANSHGLSPRQAKLRAQRVKTKSGKNKWVDSRPLWKRIAKKPFTQQQQDWDIEQITNIEGKTYWWYRKGRKVCLDTKLKVDPQGYSKYTISGTGVLTPRLRKVLINNR